jgi:phosphoribosylformylglycinamidine cyclo-ligase
MCSFHARPLNENSSVKAIRMATYEESGVSISAGEETVRRIRSIVRDTYTPGVISEIGAFGAFFAPDWKKYQDPVLVSSVDGVGTKLNIAVLAGRHDTVGQDLVNHCVNDIAVCGAEPMFFMDYFATGRLDPEVAASVVSGFAIACRENGCALIGGEIAEMPGMYAENDYDLAGTIVGIVDRSTIIDGSSIQPGDVVIGVASNGLHTNGYSLARRALLEAMDVFDTPDVLSGASIADELLKVHRSYLYAIRALKAAGLVHGLAHITGGGIDGNTSRILRPGLNLDIAWGSWSEPPVFDMIRCTGNVPEEDMRRTFNLGIGLVAIAHPDAKDRVIASLRDEGHEAFLIGSVITA